MNAQQHMTVLSNGLTLIGEVIPSRKSVALGYFVNTGARDETPEVSGVSHFLEHMMFRGSQKRSALEITYELGNLAAQSNAYTSEDHTVYYGLVLPEFFPQMFELLSDMLRPALRNEDFDTEKQVILEEIALYQDRPHFLLFDSAHQDYFGEHPAGHSVLGTTDSVGALLRDQMADYFTQRYRPSNIVLSASGNFSWKEFVSQAESLSGTWEDRSAPRKLLPFQHKAVHKTYTKENINQLHQLFVGPGVTCDDESRYAYLMWSLMLGDASGSRLYWSLIDTGLADAAGSESDERQDLGNVSVYASSSKENFSKVQEILQKELTAGEQFQSEELERARNKALARLVLEGESTMARMLALGTEYLFRKQFHTLEQEMDAIRKVHLDQVIELQDKLRSVEWARFELVPA